MGCFTAVLKPFLKEIDYLVMTFTIGSQYSSTEKRM
jgi:hypothetical protein